MRVVVATPASEEFARAIDFYGELSTDLARDLIDEFDGAIAQIGELPSSGTPYQHETRRVLLRRFPFGVVYRVKTDVAEVVAFAHHSRRPGYWTDRL